MAMVGIRRRNQDLGPLQPSRWNCCAGRIPIGRGVMLVGVGELGMGIVMGILVCFAWSYEPLAALLVVLSLRAALLILGVLKARRGIIVFHIVTQALGIAVLAVATFSMILHLGGQKALFNYVVSYTDAPSAKLLRCGKAILSEEEETCGEDSDSEFKRLDSPDKEWFRVTFTTLLFVFTVVQIWFLHTTQRCFKYLSEVARNSKAVPEMLHMNGHGAGIAPTPPGTTTQGIVVSAQELQMPDHAQYTCDNYVSAPFANQIFSSSGELELNPRDKRSDYVMCSPAKGIRV